MRQARTTDDPCLATSADEAWLRMDRAENRMIIHVLMITATPLGRAQLMALITARLLRHPRFHRALRRRGTFWRERPQDAPFDLHAHVHTAQLEDDTPSALSNLVARLMEQPLSPARPLWAVHLVEHFGRGSALIWRFHHGLSDGMALLRLLVDAADDPAVEVQPPRALSRRARNFRAARAAYSLSRLLLLPPDPRTPLKVPLCGQKRVAWSAATPVDDLKRAARAHGVTLNDLLLSALSAALHGALARSGARARNVRALIPLDLREGDNAAVGNRFGLVFLPLPVGRMTPSRRLREVTRRMDALKRQPEAAVAFAILQLIGRASPALSTLAIRVFGAKGTLVVTNVAGPRQPIRLAGAEVKDVLFWVPQAAGLGVGVSLFSYAGQVRAGVTSDATCLAHPEALADAFAKELALLAAPAAAGPERPTVRRRRKAGRCHSTRAGAVHTFRPP